MTSGVESTPHKHKGHKGIVSYVHRGGRMTVGQQRSWARDWPALGRDLSTVDAGPIDMAAWFGREAPVILEIGCGMGETTAALAAAAPEVNYLAVDVYEPGLAQLMLRARDLGVSNLRLIRGDAVELLREHIADDSLAGVRVFFPDPWPKKRHHKRRLIQPEFVAMLASKIEPDGLLHLATDWQDYADQMLRVCDAEPALRNQHGSWAPRPSWRPTTKFESRAIEEGRECRDLMFTRIR